MANPFSASNVINGTWGKFLVDGAEVTEVSAFSLRQERTYEPVLRAGSMAEDRKLVSIRYVGSFTLHHVASRFVESVKAAEVGKDTRYTFVSNLDDPDANGSEAVAAYGCSLDAVALADWATGKLGTREFAFQATSVEPIDEIEVL